MMTKKIIPAFFTGNNESFYQIKQLLTHRLAIPPKIRYDSAVIGGQYTVVWGIVSRRLQAACQIRCRVSSVIAVAVVIGRFSLGGQ